MVGYLKVDGGKFCVEYADRNVQAFWHPGAPEAAAKATRWIADALPRLEQVPETMLSRLDQLQGRIPDRADTRGENGRVAWDFVGRRIDQACLL
jgi:hypothetical protein